MASDPGLAAMDFLGKVMEGRIDLAPGTDTALLDHITERKRESIRKRIDKLGAELKGGELELGEVKEDGIFAAAMIRKTGGFDSAEAQIFPVALVKRGHKWLPAPVPASFENAVAGYTLPLKARLAALEGWMMRKRVTDLERLLAESAKRTREIIQNSIIGEDLEGDDLGKITDRFLEACATHDRAAILGFLGGLSDPLPADWSVRLKASKAAVGGGGNWRALVAPEVIRVRVHEKLDQKVGMVSIAWLDPQKAATSGVRLLHLAFSRDAAGQWMIDPPDSLLHGAEDADDEGLDMDLLDRFAEKICGMEPASPADSAEDAEDALMRALRSAGTWETLRMLDFGNRRRGDCRIAVMEAAELWWSLNEPGGFRMPVKLGFREEGSLTAFAYQWFSVGEPDRYAPRMLVFRKTAKGWLWFPGKVPSSEQTSYEALSEWADGMEAEWRLSWREVLMKPSVKLDKLVLGEAPTDREVKALVREWLDALERKDLGAALAASAWLGGGNVEIPMKALRNISYELANTDGGKAELAAIHRSGPWVAVTVLRVSGERIQRLFLPVTGSPSGPRLLPEIDLIDEDTRTRNFLNKASFERLGKFVGEEELAPLIKLFEESREKIE